MVSNHALEVSHSLPIRLFQQTMASEDQKLMNDAFEFKQLNYGLVLHLN